MKISKLLPFIGFLLVLTFVLPACLSTSNQGIPLFDGTEEEEVNGESVEPEEFGYIVEGTSCVKQLHSGCVPSDYKKYRSLAFTVPFVYPSDWVNTSADENGVTFYPRERADDNDPTVLKIWRQAFHDESYDVLKEDLIDAGTGVIGPYEVTWEIYEGLWNELPVKAEWVTLVVDEEQLLINYVYFMMTEVENFTADQAAVKAAASSILME